MKNKGFTLVELLAVVGVLAILLIMALPAVTKSLNNAKKNTFFDNVQEIYKTASLQKTVDSDGKKKKIIYCRHNGEECDGDTYLLDTTGSTALDYVITIERDNTVSFLYVANDRYVYSSAVTAEYSPYDSTTVITPNDSGLTDLMELTVDNVIDKDEVATGYDFPDLNNIGKQFTFDVNSIIDGVSECTTTSAFRVNVYINGHQTASNVGDYYRNVYYGTAFKIEYWALDGYDCSSTSEDGETIIGINNEYQSIQIKCNKTK